MQLLTDEIKELFLKNPIGSHEKDGEDANVLVKYFNPAGRGTWLITEAEKDDDDWLLFGCMHIFEWEWGYVMLSELQNIVLPYGLTIKRDLYSKGTVKELSNGGF